MLLRKQFLLLIIPLFHNISATVRTSPTWPSDCSFRHFNLSSAHPGLNYLQGHNGVSSQSYCESLCRTFGNCGLYIFTEMSQQCFTYQHSLKLLELITGIGDDGWLKDNDKYVTGSKECNADLFGTDCDLYPASAVHDRKVLVAEFSVTRILTSPPHHLEPSHCRSYCSLLSECRSVTYYTMSTTGNSYCEFFSNTITDLSKDDSGKIWYISDTAIYPNLTTYERQCSDGAYNPDIYTGPGCSLPCLNRRECKLNGSTPFCDCDENLDLAQPYCKQIPSGFRHLSYDYRRSVHSGGKCISGHSIRDVAGSSVEGCCLACSLEPRCMTVNYYQAEERCELVSVHGDMVSPPDLEEAEGCNMWTLKIE